MQILGDLLILAGLAILIAASAVMAFDIFFFWRR